MKIKKWFLDLSLMKKVNITLAGFVIVPICILGIVMAVAIYRSNTSKLYEEIYENLGAGMERVRECWADTEDIPLSCMQNEALQRIGKGRAMGRDYITVRSWIDELQESQPWYENICITLKNGKQFQTGNYVNETEEDVENILGERESVWKTSTGALYIFEEENRELLVYYGIVRSYDSVISEETAGTVSVRIREEELCRSYTEPLKQEFQSVYVQNKSGTVVTSTDRELLGQSGSAELSDAEKEVGRGVFHQGGNICFFIYDEQSGCTLVEAIPLVVFYGDILIIFVLLFAVSILCFLFCIIYERVQKKYIIHPIYDLAEAFREMEQADFVLVRESGGRDEVGALQSSFNEMSRKLNQLVNQVYRAEYERNEAQLRALTEQINPHFLYNTLDSIHWKAIRNRDSEVADQIVALSDVYRYLLNKGNEFIAIRDEVKFLEKYLYLMGMRFGSRLQWNRKIGENVQDMEIPKLIIQPLVENAIVHGIEPSEEGGKISLFILMEENGLLIQVADTGVGFGRDITLKNDETDSLEGAFAIKNINKRLKLYYPGHYEYIISSSRGGGTCVTIRLIMYDAYRSEENGGEMRNKVREEDV